MFKVGRCLLADRLRNADMTQQELAELCGMPKAQINDYVNNRKTMSLKTAKVIITALNENSHLNLFIDDLYEWKRIGRRTEM